MVIAERYKSAESRTAVSKNSRTPRLALSPLRSSLTTSVSRRYTLAPPIKLLAREIVVFADIRNCGEDISKRPLARPMQRCLQNLSVLLFSTAVSLRRLLLQGFDEILRELSHHQLRHDRLLEQQ